MAKRSDNIAVSHGVRSLAWASSVATKPAINASMPLRSAREADETGGGEGLAGGMVVAVATDRVAQDREPALNQWSPLAPRQGRLRRVDDGDFRAQTRAARRPARQVDL